MTLRNVCSLKSGDCFIQHQVIDGISVESNVSGATPGKTTLEVHQKRQDQDSIPIEVSEDANTTTTGMLGATGLVV